MNRGVLSKDQPALTWWEPTEGMVSIESVCTIVQEFTIVNDDGAGVGVGTALLKAVRLRRLVALERKLLNAVCLGRRLLGALFSCIDCIPPR